jgi:hypothetical protein
VCGTLYKFTLLERLKINNVWGSYPNFRLAHPILTRPMALKRGDIKVLHAEISDSQGLKFQNYIIRKVDEEDKLQIKGLKGTYLKIGITFYWKICF